MKLSELIAELSMIQATQKRDLDVVLGYEGLRRGEIEIIEEPQNDRIILQDLYN
jgi:hypothetical protein